MIDGIPPPNDLKLEAAVLSALVLGGRQVWTDIEGQLRPEDFYSESHRRIFEALLEILGSPGDVDSLVLADRLRTNGRLDQIGGVEYLATIINSTPAIANVGRHAQRVRELGVIRRCLHALQSATARLYHEPELRTLDVLAKDLAQLLDQRSTNDGPKLILDSLKRAFTEIRNACEANGISGLRTGLDDLDTMLTGLHAGDLYVVAGRPGMGKSALAAGAAVQACMQNKASLLFSLEMPDEQIALRLACERAGVPIRKARGGQLAPQDWLALTEASVSLGSIPMWIDDRPSVSMAHVRRSTRRVQREALTKNTSLGLVIVDYLQLARESDARSREQEVAEISRSLKELAKEFRVPVIALSQLNRQCETRTDKRPTLADLRDSGSIEQDADAVIFVYRDEVYNAKSPAKNLAELIVAKHRNGPTGTITVGFDGRITHFRNLHEYERARAS